MMTVPVFSSNTEDRHHSLRLNRNLIPVKKQNFVCFTAIIRLINSFLSEGAAVAKKGILTKILAIVGTVLVWLPIAAPLILAAVSLIGDGKFRLDYLLPAELFPLVIAGFVLLFWAAIRARAYLKPISWTFSGTAALILGINGAAAITGLASGKTDANGWQFILVMSLLVILILAVILLGVYGILLVRNLYQQENVAPAA